MDSRDEIRVPGETGARPDLAAVERLYDLIERDGVMAGIEHLVSLCHDDVEMRAYAVRATGGPGEIEHDVLHGRDEILTFFRTRLESGFTFRLRTRGFDVDSDTVVARGSIRVGRPDGSFAEANLRWKFHFRDGLVDEVAWEPRAGG